jgi:uracil permease
MSQTPPEADFRYTLEQWPPPMATAVLALQWLVALLPGLLALGDVLALAQGLDGAGRLAFMQRLLVMAALVQGAQVLWGHGLPGLVGPSAVLLVAALGTLGAGAPAVYGAMAVGGALTALAGVTGLAGRLGRLYTPPVLASTLLLLIVSLTPTMRDQMFHPGPGGGSPATAFAFALGLALVMFWAQQRLGGLVASAVLFLGMVLGSLAWYVLGLGVLPALEQAAGAGSWGLALPNLGPVELSFEPGVIAAFAVCYLALIANELASVEALGPLTGAQGMPRRASRAVLMSGLGGLLSGVWGLPGPVTYSLSPGVLFASRCASRWTLLPAAGLLLLLALWPRGLAMARLVPPAVVGAVLFALMAHSVYAALQLLFRSGQGGEARAGLVVGASLTVGLVVTFMPAEARQSLPPLLRPILANGFVAGLALALIMEHLVLPRRK